MLDPFDKSRCSIAVPDFVSEEEEERWAASLSSEQGFELLRLMQQFRWGDEVINRPMGRTVMQVMTMDEFNAMKERENAAEDDWRESHGLPRRFT